MSDYYEPEIINPNYGQSRTIFDQNTLPYHLAPNFEGTPTQFYDDQGLRAILLNDGQIYDVSSFNPIVKAGEKITADTQIQGVDEEGRLLYLEDPNDPFSTTYKPTDTPYVAGSLSDLSYMRPNRKSGGVFGTILSDFASVARDPEFHKFAAAAAAMAGAAALAPAAVGAGVGTASAGAGAGTAAGGAGVGTAAGGWGGTGISSAAGGLGLKAPTAASLASMGGGTGLIVPAGTQALSVGALGAGGLGTLGAGGLGNITAKQALSAARLALPAIRALAGAGGDSNSAANQRRLANQLSGGNQGEVANQVQVKSSPLTKIDYLYDIGGESIFAPMGEKKLPDSDIGLYADGGLVAFDEGGGVTQEELEAALRPVTFNPRIAASGETSRRNKKEALARQQQGPEDTVVDEYGNVIRFSDYGRAAPTLEDTVQQLTGMEPGVERSIFLPYSKEAGVHVPEIIYGGIKSILSPEQARKYGNVTGKEGVETAMNLMGGALGVSSGLRNPTGSGGTDLGMFIGKNSKTWDKKSYDRAIELERMGRTPDEIQALTGNVKDQSGQWAQMINDRTAWVSPSNMPKSYSLLGNAVRAKDLLKHPQLYKAYPELANTRVVLTPGSGAYFDPVTKVIGLGDKSLSPDAIKSNILHELQHYIQHKEGFPRGGSPDAFKSEIINPNSAFRKNPLGKPIAELYDLFVTDPIAFFKYRKLEGEAQSRATERTRNMDATQQRVMPISKQYDIPLKNLDSRPRVDFGWGDVGYANGGLIGSDDLQTIDDLYEMLRSK